MKLHRLTTQHTTRSVRAVAGAAALTLVLAACGSSAPTAGEATAESVATAETVATADSITLDTHADGDEADYDEGEAVTVTLADGSTSSDGDGVEVTRDDDGETVLITAAGTYVLSGTLTDGQVVVDVPEEEDVTIVLDGADITSSVGPALQFVSAEDATVVLEPGSQNRLADPATYAQTDDTVDENGDTVDAPNAALYSTADLTIAGDGALVVEGSANDGITSKDGLVILSGEVTVTAADDGIRGKDFLSIEGGTITVDAAGDGLTSDNTDEGTGIVRVTGADTTVTVASGDDAIKGENVVDIVDGTVTVTSSVEGIESARIILEGGTVEVTSSDDAINGASDTAAASVEISGGTITLDSEGDGLDSNGSVTMTGGRVTVYGPTTGGKGSLDVDGAFVVSGGTLVAVGTADMLIAPSSDGGQTTLVATFSGTVQAGTLLQITDADGTVIAEVTTAKTAQSLVLSDAALVSGETYRVTADGVELGTATAGEYAGGAGGPGQGGYGGGQGGGGPRG